jgi:hypothetical protein
MKKNKAIKLGFLLVGFFLPLLVSAVTLENNYPTLPGGPSSFGNSIEFFLYAFNFLLYIGGGVAILAIIYQGVRMVISAGDMAKVSEAKDRIKAALFGLVLLLGSFVILYTINPELTKINLPSIDITNGIRWDTTQTVSHGVSYKEIPLGSIIESILIPDSTTKGQLYNYSQLVNKTEEQCYLYDKDGNTIDRNNDGKIDESDAVEGLDMSICMNNLLDATRRKIALFNGNDTICNGNIANTEGPINAMKHFIVAKDENGVNGCSESNCALWPSVTYPAVATPNGWPDGCFTKTESFTCYDSEGNAQPPQDGTICDEHCGCCGGPRGIDGGAGNPTRTDDHCQIVPDASNPFYTNNTYADKDPCTSRQKIDCARQEMNYRIYGKGLGLGLKCAGVYDYSPDIAPFIDEDNDTLKIIDETDATTGKTYKAEFLTFKMVVDFTGGKTGPTQVNEGGRLNNFKKYFDNRIKDLDAARDAINADKTKKVLSLAEFQDLQDKSTDNISIDLFTGSSNVYDSISFRSFNCTGYNLNNSKNLCNTGELVGLQNTGWPFLPGETISGVTTSGEGTAMTGATFDATNYVSDSVAAGWPFKAKRIWNNKLATIASTPNDLHNSGDPATLYVLSNPGTTDPTKYPEAARAGIIDNSPTKNACTLTKGDKQTTAANQINKETLISRIPIGELADGLSNYVTQLDGIITSTANEVGNVIEAADQIANRLPESCNCTLNTSNKANCQGDATACPGTGECGAPKCSSCVAKNQNVCDFGCLDCASTTMADTAAYACLRTRDYHVGIVYQKCNDPFLGASGCGQQSLFLSPYSCGFTDAARTGNTSTEYILSHPDMVTEEGHCSCAPEGYYVAETSSCALGNQVPGSAGLSSPRVLCTADLVGRNWSTSSFRDSVLSGGACQCIVDQYGPNPDMCMNATGNTSEQANSAEWTATGCSVSQLTNGEFAKDSSCYNIVQRSRPTCLTPISSIVLGPFWEMVPGSCTDGKHFKIKPTLTSSSMSCEEDITKLTPAEQDQISQMNTGLTGLAWNDENSLTYDDVNIASDCCTSYKDADTGHMGANVIAVPSGFKSYCSYNFTTKKYSIRVEKAEAVITGSGVRPAPKNDTKPYYVCPYNEIKTEQSRIYKKVTTPSLTGLSTLGTDQDCLADVPGFLQRIETWQKRLWDFQYAKNLLPTDENRFTLLDTLNVSRSRFNQCIQGFGQSYKDAAVQTYLFTCEQGISAQKLGSLLILPEFPPHNSQVDAPNISSEMWNCYPFNSSRLNNDQKTDCFNNKDKNSECQEYIKNYTNDFYCCQGGLQ